MRAIMNDVNRRRMLIVLGTNGLTGCDWISAHPSNPANAKLSDEDRALKFKYRGIRGAELLVDSLEETQGVNMFDDRGGRFYGSASLSVRNRSRHSYSGGEIALPKWIRVEWRDKIKMEEDGAFKRGLPPGSFYGGSLLGNHTVKIAERIPDDLLDEVRAHRGGLRLKIRVHPQGVLVGGDLRTGLTSYFVGGTSKRGTWSTKVTQ